MALALRFERLTAEDYIGTCEGPPGGRSYTNCDGTAPGDWMRGRRARWVETNCYRRVCGTCKRKWLRSDGTV